MGQLPRVRTARYLKQPNYSSNLLRCGFTQSGIDNMTDRDSESGYSRDPVDRQDGTARV